MASSLTSKLSRWSSSVGEGLCPERLQQTFFADNGIKIAVSTPKKVTFDDVAEALTQATEEVRHYIDQGRLAF